MTDTEQMEQVEKTIEISIEAAKGAVQRKNAVERLIRHKDFVEVFTKGYMESEPARLVSLLADAEWQSEERQSELIKDMRAISSFRQYILGIKSMGRQMEQQIAGSEAQLDEMRNEATEEGE